MGYSDLKQAYSKNGIINTRTVQARKSYRNIDEYERARSNIKYDMTPEELEYQERLKAKEEREEELRLQRMRNHDNQVFSHYNKVHQMMLEKLK